MNRKLAAIPLAIAALSANAQQNIDIKTDPTTVVTVNGEVVSVPPPVVVVPPAPLPVTAWVRIAYENEPFTVAGSTIVRYGEGSAWATKVTSTSGTCSVSFFGVDPKPGRYKYCESQVTVPAVVQDPMMAVVNPGLIARSALAFNTARVRQLTPTELQNPVFQPTPSTQGGAFRTVCGFSHFSFDDFIVYPGQPGAAHFHTFLGNNRAAADSTTNSLMTTGDSTCAGGTLNRTAYWMPSLIDIRTGQPLVPFEASFYYKTGYGGVDTTLIKPFPKGLRIIAGNSKGTTPVNTGIIGLECVSGGGHKPSIPSCAIGDKLNVSVIFPQCWDGVNLDSPDHKSHMAYAKAPAGCPASHPVAFPEIALNVHYVVTEANSGTFWRLSSDMYVGPGGYSMHADWANGWDPATLATFVKECMNKKMDCHSYLLGDGRILY